MKVLIVYCHPSSNSFTYQVKESFIQGLEEANHSYEISDLYEECLAFLKESDIVITNPPFSLFRKLVSLLIKYNKLFLLIGNENTFASTEMFPLIKDGKVWTGLNKIRKFKRPNEADREFGNVCWFTNLSNNKQNEELILTKEYSKEKYPVYDNYYTAINVDSLADIPKDYNGIMGVPVSYIGKYNNN